MKFPWYDMEMSVFNCLADNSMLKHHPRYLRIFFFKSWSYFGMEKSRQRCEFQLFHGAQATYMSFRKYQHITTVSNLTECRDYIEIISFSNYSFFKLTPVAK